MYLFPYLDTISGIFAEQEFRDRYIGSMKVKMMKDSKKDDNVHLLIEWMKGEIGPDDGRILTVAILRCNKKHSG